MRLILLIGLAGFGMFQGTSLALGSLDTVNGHFIPEPTLHDYIKAERTPGFSKITEVIDTEGKPVSL